MNKMLKSLGIVSLITGAMLAVGCNKNPIQGVSGNDESERFIAAATKYEAENAALTAPATNNPNPKHAGYSGTSFVAGFYNVSGGQVDFTVNVPSVGSYKMVLRYSAGNGTSTSMGLFIGSTRIKTLTCNGTGAWTTWANLTETVTLASGNNHIIFKSEATTSKVINLDYITIESTTPPSSFTITASAGANGTISPSGSVTVTSGANQTFTFTPTSGYQVSAVTVDGASAGTSTSYVFNNVTANHTISVSFQAVSTQKTITASAGANGSISPSGNVMVNNGASQTFTFTPTSGYQVSGITVDGASIAAAPSYTFTNVTANHTISVTFAAAQPSTKYEAENATLTSPATNNPQPKHAGYSGSSFVAGFYNQSTGQVDFTVNVSSAGSYKMVLRYSAGNGTSTSMGLFIGSTRIKTLTCNGTGAWTTWANLNETITLASGTNHIIFKNEASTSKCINLDYITITSNGSPSTYQLTVTSGTGGTITAPATSPVTVNAGAATTITALQSTGYEFAGWTVTSGSASVANGALMTTTATLYSNATISASWRVRDVNIIVYSATGGTRTVPAMDAIIVKAFSSNTITVVPTTGYDFAGWTITDGTGTIADRMAMSTTVTPSTNVIIWANWTVNPNYHRVIYHSNGGFFGTVPTDSKYYRKNDWFTVQGNTGELVDPNGHTFWGWVDDPNAIGVSFPNGYQGPFPNDAADLNLYANYSDAGTQDNCNNFYENVRIGSHLWLKENLRTTKYRDGTDIPVDAVSNWDNITTPVMCGMEDNLQTGAFGALYNGHAVKTGKLAPAGYHVATEAEWIDLLQACQNQWGNRVCPLKDNNPVTWTEIICATNQSGFMARGNGGRANTMWGGFKDAASWWTSTAASGTTNRAYFLGNEESDISTVDAPFIYGYGVRCVRDRD